MQSGILGVEATERNGYTFKFVLCNGAYIYMGKISDGRGYITIKHGGMATEYLIDNVVPINAGFKYELSGKKKVVLYEYRMNNKPREFVTVEA
jgi:hypothetical protein